MVIGNYVKIIDTGKIYTTYQAMFDKLNFKKSNKKYRDCKIGEKGVIFAISQHLANKDFILYAIELNSGEQILIGKEGVLSLKDKIHELW